MATQNIDLRQAREKATARVVPPAPERPADIPLTPREASLPITYHAPDGATYTDVLRLRILTYDGHAGVARMEADMAAGRPFESMSAGRRGWISKMALVTHYLVEIPVWLNTWLAEDQELLQAIFENCQAHNYIFFRPDPAQGEGASQRSRVVVDSPLVTQASALLR